jgi:hypothetical protein
MGERENFIKHRKAYLTLGDLDKPFHLPECECERCEDWRWSKGRPTHAELRAMDDLGGASEPPP